MAWLTWLGGGDRLELNERHERSTHAVAGVVVLVNVVLTWLVTTLAVMPAVHMSAPVVVPFTLVFALLVGAMARAIATGPTRGAAGRGATAMAVVLVMALGGVVGEFAALALFSGSIDRVIQQQAARNAVSAPAVVQQSTNLQQMREARGRARPGRRRGPCTPRRGPDRRTLRIPSHSGVSADPNHRRTRFRTRNPNGQ